MHTLYFLGLRLERILTPFLASLLWILNLRTGSGSCFGAGDNGRYRALIYRAGIGSVQVLGAPEVFFPVVRVTALIKSAFSKGWGRRGNRTNPLDRRMIHAGIMPPATLYVHGSLRYLLWGVILPPVAISISQVEVFRIIYVMIPAMRP